MREMLRLGKFFWLFRLLVIKFAYGYYYWLLYYIIKLVTVVKVHFIKKIIIKL